MAIINVQDAKTHFSALMARAENGEDIIIARAGKPVAKLVALGKPAPRTFGGLKFVVPEDFDSPLSEAELAAWE